MGTKKFSSEFSSRGAVKVTDKLMITNIDTGATEFTTVAELLAAFNIAVNSGNVGIGTTTPESKLEVGGTQIRMFDPAQDKTNYSYITTTASSVNTQKLTIGTTYGFSTPVDAITIFNGNVGIGTTTPTAKLQVVGLIEYTDNAAALTGGLTVGAFYRTGDLLKAVH